MQYSSRKSSITKYFVPIKECRHQWSVSSRNSVKSEAILLLADSNMKFAVTRTHTTVLRPFFPGPAAWAGAIRKTSSGLYGATEDNRGRYPGHPAGFYSISTNQWPTSIIPPFLCRIPFLPQPSHFILAWDRHQLACTPSGVNLL